MQSTYYFWDLRKFNGFKHHMDDVVGYKEKISWLFGSDEALRLFFFFFCKVHFLNTINKKSSSYEILKVLQCANEGIWTFRNVFKNLEMSSICIPVSPRRCSAILIFKNIQCMHLCWLGNQAVCLLLWGLNNRSALRLTRLLQTCSKK